MPPPLAPPIHQTYILPPTPFRRRQSSTFSSSSYTPSSPRSYSVFSSPTSPVQDSIFTPGTSYSSTSPNSSPVQYSSPHSNTLFKELPYGKGQGQGQQHRQPQRRQSYLTSHTSHISCAKCKASLALTSQIISKGFTGRHGRAYLVDPCLDNCIHSSITANSRQRRRSSAAVGEKDGNGIDVRTGGEHQGQQRAQPPTWTRRRSSALVNALAYTLSLASLSPSSSTTTSNSSTTSPSSSPSTSSTTASSTTFTSSAKSTNIATPPSLPNTLLSAPTQRHLVTGLHTVCDISCAVCNSGLGWKYLKAEEEGQKYKEGKYILETGRVIVGVEWGAVDEEVDEESVDVLNNEMGRSVEAGVEKGKQKGDMAITNAKGKRRISRTEEHGLDNNDLSPGPSRSTRPNNRRRSTFGSIISPSTSNTFPSLPANTQMRNNPQWQHEHTPVFDMDNDDDEEEDDDDDAHSSNEDGDSTESIDSANDDENIQQHQYQPHHQYQQDRRNESRRASKHHATVRARHPTIRTSITQSYASDREVQFDSQNESECELLFAGMWNADLVREKRRRQSSQKAEQK